MKLKKAKARLDARIKEWEALRGTFSTKDCRVADSTFRKPGSFKK